MRSNPALTVTLKSVIVHSLTLLSSLCLIACDEALESFEDGPASLFDTPAEDSGATGADTQPDDTPLDGTPLDNAPPADARGDRGERPTPDERADAPPPEDTTAPDDETEAEPETPTETAGTGTDDRLSDWLLLPDVPFNYVPTYPAHVRAAAGGPGGGGGSTLDEDSQTAANPVTNAGATLGRALFYDTTLSANDSTSCASCHRPENGFGDPRALSRGFDGGLTGRHSMGLTNARFNRTGAYFWDMRADSLEEQVLMPIQDPVEMGLTLQELVTRVDAQPYYGPLFADAFGDDSVTSDRISRALAQFVRSLVSFDARYDAGRAQVANPTDAFPNFTAEENRGKALFFAPIGGGGPGGPGGAGGGACISCHATEAFVGLRPTSNGLDARTTDEGFGAVTGRPQDDGLFRTPSLRNVATRAPFMHDGRFQTLEQVVRHYSNGVQDHPNLSPPLRGNGGPNLARFSGEDVDAMVAFLNTLTDRAMLADERFSDPFVR